MLRGASTASATVATGCTASATPGRAVAGLEARSALRIGPLYSTGARTLPLHSGVLLARKFRLSASDPYVPLGAFHAGALELG
jgi:hypothetical protein